MIRYALIFARRLSENEKPTAKNYFGECSKTRVISLKINTLHFKEWHMS